MDFQIIFIIVGALFLAWSLGANDASNCFGVSVSSKIVSYRLAVLLCSISLILGAFFQGSAGIETYQSLSSQNLKGTLSIIFSSTFCIIVANLLKISISTSQVIVGAIVGFSFFNRSFNLQPFIKIILCWVSVPIVSIVFSWGIYFILVKIFERLRVGILEHDIIIKYLLIIIGCYASYALGANNVANIVGVLPQNIFDIPLSNHDLSLLAGGGIALGVITYSKRMMLVVGRGIFRIDGFGSLVAVLSSALLLHVFAIIGVPVSSSHSIIGAVFGVGIIRGGTEINYKKIYTICLGWLISPFIAFVLTIFLYSILQ